MKTLVESINSSLLLEANEAQELKKAGKVFKKLMNGRRQDMNDIRELINDNYDDVDDLEQQAGLMYFSYDGGDWTLVLCSNGDWDPQKEEFAIKHIEVFKGSIDDNWDEISKFGK